MTASHERATTHRLHFADARTMDAVPDAGVDLVVTSPPYPMIAMWDDPFAELNPFIADALARDDGDGAFALMHEELDCVWAETVRVLRPGGFLCIVVGDATRTCAGAFRLFPNHARILMRCAELGLTPLPDVLWRKPTNGPTKFMGSGMLPAGAYVTYEHEYVLILRRGGKRAFADEAARVDRRRSAFFWEERNVWFSDVWTDLRGARQALHAADVRARSGAFPFELAWRLIQMYSVAGDVVLDPFAGTGTTSVAAAASARSSIGYEIDAALAPAISTAFAQVAMVGNERIDQRLRDHASFVVQRTESGRELRHRNEFYDVPVMTGQERDAAFWRPVGTREVEVGSWTVDHRLDARVRTT